MAEERRLLAVFAHPDDEMSVAGTLALYAAQGVQVCLVCATRGEMGEISDPSLATQETLGQVREGELREACRVLGIQEPVFLGYRDSGMRGTQENSHPASLNKADSTEVVDRLAQLIGQLKPQVVITFDPTGIYGHPDHILVHKYTREAFFLARQTKGYATDPLEPRRLYYVTIPKGVIRQLAKQMQAAGMPPHEHGEMEGMGTPDEEVTTSIDVSPCLNLKRRAMRAHRTQMGPDNPFSNLPKEVLASFSRVEFFHREHPPAGPGQQEKSLF